MKNFILTALLLLCAFSIHSAEHGKNIPKSIANETTFNFTGMSNIDWSEVSSSAYQEEPGYQGGIDIYIHTDRYEEPNLYVWDADGNKLNGDWPGTANGKYCYVAPSNDQENKRTYYKFHFDNVTAVNFIVNFGGSDQTGDAHILEAGAYFFDYIENVGWNYNHNEKNETHHTLKARNEYYTGGTDGSHTTVYVKSNTYDFIPATYWWNVYNDPGWNTDWVWQRHPAQEIWLQNEKWYHFDFELSEICTTNYYDNATHSYIDKYGGVIISKWMDVNYQTCDIDWMRDGDYFFYYLPYAPYDKYEVAAMLNGRSHNFKEWSFESKPYVGEDVKITLIDPNTLEFASLEQDGFTLTLSDPSGLSLNQCIKTIDGVPMLRLNLNATLTLRQNDGHIINMLAFDGIYKNKTPIMHDQMLSKQMGYFHKQNQPAKVTKVIDKHGNNYDEFGGYEKTYTCEENEISFTFNDKDYALEGMNDGKYIAFKSITVRDADISSGLVDMYGAYRVFWWNITDSMAVLRYAPEEGVLYCRSLKDSETWVHPRPSQDQINRGLVANNIDDYTNYNWLAIFLPDELLAEFEETYGTDVKHRIIKPGTIQGYYCDFAIDANGSNPNAAPRRARTQDAIQSYEAVAYLNPTIKATCMPVLLDDTVATKLNVYTPFNFSDQKEVFFATPKRNEVCNIMYAIPNFEDGKSLFGTKYTFIPKTIDEDGNEVVNYEDSVPLNGWVRVHGENCAELFKKLCVHNDDIKKDASSTFRYCENKTSANIEEGVMQIVNIVKLKTVSWEYHKKCEWELEDDEENWHPFWQPQPGPDSLNCPLAYEQYQIREGNTNQDFLDYLPDDEYTFFDDSTPEKRVQYYEIYKYSLAINPVLAAKRKVNVWVSEPEIIIGSYDAAKTVASVEYYNATGLRGKEPFAGFNVVVTRYSDGTMSAKKIMNPTK